MFVSTRKATLVNILADPSPPAAWRTWDAGLRRRLFRAGRRLTLAGPSRRLIEQLQAPFDRCRLGRLRHSPLDDTDGVASGQPIEIVSGADFILVGDRLGKSELKFAGNSGHNIKFSKDTILVQSLF